MLVVVLLLAGWGAWKPTSAPVISSQSLKRPTLRPSISF
jgi:hypothetical protein